MKPSIPAVLGSMILGAALTVPVAEAVGASARSLALSTPTTAVRVDPALRNAKGVIDVVVQLPDAPLANAMGENALREGGGLNRAQQVAHSAQITREQNTLAAKIAGSCATRAMRLRTAAGAARRTSTPSRRIVPWSGS